MPAESRSDSPATVGLTLPTPDPSAAELCAWLASCPGDPKKIGAWLVKNSSERWRRERSREANGPRNIGPRRAGECRRSWSDGVTFDAVLPAAWIGGFCGKRDLERNPIRRDRILGEGARRALRQQAHPVATPNGGSVARLPPAKRTRSTAYAAKTEAAKGRGRRHRHRVPAPANWDLAIAHSLSERFFWARPTGGPSQPVFSRSPYGCASLPETLQSECRRDIKMTRLPQHPTRWLGEVLAIVPACHAATPAMAWKPTTHCRRRRH